VYRDGWTLEKALTTKPAPRNKKVDNRKLNYDDGVDIYLVTMRRFYTKEHRLQSYRTLIAEMKSNAHAIDPQRQIEVLAKHEKTQKQRETLCRQKAIQKNFEVSDRWTMRLVG
jgi:hypothetical protein